MMPTNPDLHCHSTVSDGLLAPAEVVERAAANGVDLLSLTDHDEVDGLDEAIASAAALGLRFVSGVEISVSWGDDHTLHVVGLNIDHRNPALVAGLARVRSGRDARAVLMAEELAKAGIEGAYEGALKYVGNPALISRSHFARYIVERGFAPDVKTVFDHWLAKGKPGYVRHVWAELGEAIDWIQDAGGIA
ncbi:MAG: PHP domain-containing protein, partial [Rhodocyclaceae bacterium]